MAAAASLNQPVVNDHTASSSPPQGLGSSPSGGAGRLQQVNLPQAQRDYVLWMHLSMFATVLVLPALGAVIPMLMWLTRREQSAFIDDHGRELANVLITGAILTATLPWIPVAGWIALAIWYLITAVNIIRGARAGRRGEYFRYPVTF
ncbi:MAG: DUF4870 domain-containing protein, partial [Myxococcota bacterium]